MGPRYTHGVIFDFMKKLRQDPHALHILGDGTQRKSYLHVEDGIEAILLALDKAREKVNLYNLGNKEWISVTDLADILCNALKLNDVTYDFSGGKRGWKGDTPFVHLDIQKISSLGWNPKYDVEATIRSTIHYLQLNEDLLFIR